MKIVHILFEWIKESIHSYIWDWLSLTGAGSVPLGQQKIMVVSPITPTATLTSSCSHSLRLFTKEDSCISLFPYQVLSKCGDLKGNQKVRFLHMAYQYQSLFTWLDYLCEVITIIFPLPLPSLPFQVIDISIIILLKTAL